MSFAIRDAIVAVHGSFARLFPELRVADPLPPLEQFAERMLPNVVILEERGDAMGYAHWRRYGPTVHLVHVVVETPVRAALGVRCSTKFERERLPTGARAALST